MKYVISVQRVGKKTTVVQCFKSSDGRAGAAMLQDATFSDFKCILQLLSSKTDLGKAGSLGSLIPNRGCHWIRPTSEMVSGSVVLTRGDIRDYGGL